MKDIDRGIYARTDYDIGYEEGRREAEEICERERMTLRDQFAMAALTGILGLSNGEDSPYFVTEEEKIAVFAYKYADAMLAARKGGE